MDNDNGGRCGMLELIKLIHCISHADERKKGIRIVHNILSE